MLGNQPEKLNHAKLQAEGRRSRQAALDAILELLTGDSISSAQMRESAMALVYFEPKILAEIDRIGRPYDEPKTRELRAALLLGIAWREVAVCRSHVAMIFARACRRYQNTRTGRHVLKRRIYVMAAEV